MRKLLLLAYIAAGAAYMGWRAFYSNPVGWPVWGTAFLLSEFYVIGYGAFFWYIVLERPAAAEEPPPYPQTATVDVLVATYNEDLAIVRAAAVAARELDHPHVRVLICDDGKRPECERLAHDIGVGYVTRPNNKHFKSGNLNNALVQCTGDFVVLCDADQVLRPEFLKRTLGWFFADAGLAILQTPQTYWNVDSFSFSVWESKNRLWHESSIFHHWFQHCADRFNIAFSVGTGVVIRRAALDAVGGMATNTITEDIMTTYRLHTAGWRSKWLDESLGYLLAPETPVAYAKQRLRWAQGDMGNLRNDNPLFNPHLTPIQRIGYLHSFTWSFGSYPYLAFVLSPFLFVCFQVSPFGIDPLTGVPVVASYMAAGYLLYRVMGGPFVELFQADCFRMINLPIHLRATSQLVIPAVLTFVVTPKGAHAGAPPWVWAPIAVVGALNATAVGYATWLLATEPVFDVGIAFASLFATYFLVTAAVVLRRMYRYRAVHEEAVVPVSMTLPAVLPSGQDGTLRVTHFGPEHLYVRPDPKAPLSGRIQADLSAYGGPERVDLNVAPAGDERKAHQGLVKLVFAGLTGEEIDQIGRLLFNSIIPAFLGRFPITSPQPPPEIQLGDVGGPDVPLDGDAPRLALVRGGR